MGSLGLLGWLCTVCTAYFLKNLGFVWVFLLHFFRNKSSTLVRVRGWPFKQVFGKLIEFSPWALNIASLFQACVLPFHSRYKNPKFGNLWQWGRAQPTNPQGKTREAGVCFPLAPGRRSRKQNCSSPASCTIARSQTDIPLSGSPQGLVALLPMEQDRCQMPRQPPTHTPGILGSKGSSDWKKNKRHLKKMCFSCLAQHSTAWNTLRSCCSWP